MRCQWREKKNLTVSNWRISKTKRKFSVLEKEEQLTLKRVRKTERLWIEDNEAIISYAPIYYYQHRAFAMYKDNLLPENS